jgi:hypothetical protein
MIDIETYKESEEIYINILALLGTLDDKNGPPDALSKFSEKVIKLFEKLGTSKNSQTIDIVAMKFIKLVKQKIEDKIEEKKEYYENLEKDLNELEKTK